MKTTTVEDIETIKKYVFWNSTLATCFMVVYFFVCSSTLKMEAKFSSETSVDFQRSDNLKSYNSNRDMLWAEAESFESWQRQNFSLHSFQTGLLANGYRGPFPYG
jgi:preprotein translocase subunit SecF